MNQGQAQFSSYILERVTEDKVEEAKALLADNFEKQEKGTFTQKDAAKFNSKIVILLKPDKVKEVQEVIKKFAENFKE
ncbi:CRISPR/Cas system-associated protein Cas7 (RAMP superfamily) [Clostridium acetobutylicum]|uniref:Uncharacterized protein n=1 Tax=Clostridium acetobutylicum (strain ATCC 824 / DSM 792 / JCM 1419 / IAM 19013 / LMG 5710 / NBRC 13948 / NRRL B-527 / VKM B-1787 / 2291 / W) TaxID=272562 RepID=Q97LU9_CLOAB|nr:MULTISPECIES: hypothetical protein [Clostridium]AAK78435.1 Hypothetical protein CA_C0455 [Clostridium acetobutylicum ATCC 824]ADZ19505.1 Conserved hypothetical protein [Clostridium acetobutylicum EA 2018]AEI31252.1 hypothetical protein SMB_G0465 [Clostridium acetobutylicum DSM 1731]AWV80157.1 hypothetical protein DK921_08635 [Clostridium acetobutylicum]MBC2392338.1 hypothetical protein [Clostridium acetobutylicum]